jgi:murein L,D-transpeptidase YcbB/YkuD
MKKRIVVSLPALCILVVLALACSNNGSSKAPAAAEPPPKQKVSPQLAFRPGIDSSNACSTLFLDSGRLEKFIEKEKIAGETAAEIRSFYNNRAFQFAWFTGNGFTEQALAFRSLYDYDKDSSLGRRQLDGQLDKLINIDSLAPDANDPHIVSIELMMSWRFVNYLDKKFPGDKERYAALENLIPYEKRPTSDWINQVKKNPVQIASKNVWIHNLGQSLDRLSGIEKNGGWDNLPLSVKKYRDKKNFSLLTRLKKRLAISGLLQPDDTSAVFTASLKTAIKKAQAQYGYAHDTSLTIRLLKELNITVQQRIRQVIINLERMKWMPDMPDREYILVNIPEFKLHMRQENQAEFDIDIITGKEGHSTVVFSGNLNQVVFNPYWNLTDSIVKKEILPRLKKNKDYLETQHMEKTGERNGIPVIRQLPGEWNELGKIKFLFPNSQQIYFHDTPHKWLFNKDQRAYSHGCIRLAEPKKLAEFLLKDNPGWTGRTIDSAMNSDKEKWVKLKTTVPVFIYYYTAWMDEAGVLQFRKDIYGHDAEFAERLFNP